MKSCGLHCLLLQALWTGGYSNNGFLLIQASDALIKLDHRMQNPWVLCSHPRPGGWASTRAEAMQHGAPGHRLETLHCIPECFSSCSPPLPFCQISCLYPIAVCTS